MYYYTLTDYLQKQFGEKLYKLTLNGNMSCPNRDGKVGTRGCIFCSEHGSGEFAQSFCDIDTQIENAKTAIANKFSGTRYIAYFQPFSNTYQSVDNLEKLFDPVIMREDIAALSIATRPDCLPCDVLELLYRLNRIKPVWVELGLQTIHKQTAEYIRRGYELETYDTAVRNLKSLGINVITHLILGLPGETREKMIQSAEYAGAVSDGIKFHMLYVAEGTDLQKEYESNRINLLTLEQYTDILSDCIRHVPKNVVIHRITGDADKATLIAPKFSADKKKVLQAILDAFIDKNVVQGEYLAK